ncbi:TPA: DUF1642 domain-containing protein [Streptococcus suis]|nr:DUF1642 domain-containing protein [Streptococcus suis]HEM6101228.1 DUF1642 domain-containing protein [Streptococcus suis]HEM6104993.1 DUF1642 domain-containing protein [Streptococcus suis]HEM6107544.1 DUF1642 domain-containing protein [Streptococcus suis]HEM6113512.1 DUF1642 domain-containing protein [Streptococcus suis]
MNKQELEKQAEALYTDVRSFLDNIFELIDQIHEPQRVVVSKEVAEWIEGCKRSGWHLEKVLCRLDDDEKVGDWAYDENDDLIPEKVDMIARALLDGYEIEQEQLYTVEIPNPNRTTEPIIYLSRDEGGKIFLNNWFLHVSQNWKNQPHARLAEAEIKQDFEWAWQFAKEVE